MNELWKHYATWKKSVSVDHVLYGFHLDEMSRIGKSTETEKWIGGFLGLEVGKRRGHTLNELRYVWIMYISIKLTRRHDII